MNDLETIKKDWHRFSELTGIKSPGGHCKCFNAAGHKHGDRHGSLSVSIAEDGVILFQCMACGIAGTIVDAHALIHHCTPAESIKALASNGSGNGNHQPAEPPMKPFRRAYPTADELRGKWRKSGFKLAAEYQYLDDAGKWAFSQVRLERPGTSKTFRPMSPCPEGVVEALPDEPRPLFGLQSIEGAKEVLVVEGEKCVQCAVEVGFAATTSAGGSKSASKTAWTPLAGKAVIIWPDNDEPGTKYAEEVSKILGELNPTPSVRIVDPKPLDLPVGGDLVDMVDRLTAEKKNQNEIAFTVKAILSNARLVEPTQPALHEEMESPDEDCGVSDLLAINVDVQDLASILANPPSKPADLIADVAFVGSKITLAAPSKARKTFFQLHLGLCVATGSEWFGHRTLKSRVLYLNLELNPWSLQNRCHAILNRMEAKLDVDEFFVWNLRGQSVTIEKLQHGIATRMRGAQYGLICVDPLYKILGDREENAAGSMGDLLGRLEAIGHDAGAAVLVAHHFAKGNSSEKSAIDRAAGSGVVARDGDLIMTLTPHEQDECYSMEMIQRDHAPVASTVLKWIYPMFEVDHTLNPENLKKSTQRAEPVTTDDILEACGVVPQSREAIMDAVAKATGRGERAVWYAFQSAISQNLLRVETTPRPNARPMLRYSKP